MTPEELKQLQEPSALDFIRVHADRDPVDVALMNPAGATVSLRACAEQIACRQRAKKKLPLLAETDFLYDPVALEQCSNQWCARDKARFMRGGRLLDLTAGLGIDSILLSGVFHEVACCESDAVRSGMLRVNLEILGKTNVSVETAAAAAVLEASGDNRYDWIYCDPSRRDGRGRHVDPRRCSPDVVALQDMMLRKAPCACIKMSPLFDIDEARGLFPALHDVRVVSVDGEVKETLLILSREASACFRRTAVVIRSRAERVHEYDSRSSGETMKAERVGRFLLEPDPAVCKADLAGVVGARFNAAGLSATIDYLTTDVLPRDFPGRVFEVVSEIPWRRKDLGEYCRRAGIEAASVTRRNFPVAPDKLRKMFRLRESAEDFLVCTQLCGKPAVIHARRVDLEASRTGAG